MSLSEKEFPNEGNIPKILEFQKLTISHDTSRETPEHSKAIRDIIRSLKGVQSLVLHMSLDFLRVIPQHQRQNISDFCEGAITRYNALERHLSSANPEQEELSRIAAATNKLLEDAHESLLPLYLYSVTHLQSESGLRQIYDSVQAAYEKRLSEKHTELDAIRNQAEIVQKEANEALAHVKELSAEWGVTQQATHFRNEARAHSLTSLAWLFLTVGLGVSLTAIGVFAVANPSLGLPTPTNNFEIATALGGKILIIGSIGLLLRQSIKNFSGHKHNEVTNRHRQNALMSYRALYEAGHTPEGRETIIQHAAAAIYAPTESGFIRSNSVPTAAQLATLSPKSLINLTSPTP